MLEHSPIIPAAKRIIMNRRGFLKLLAGSVASAAMKPVAAVLPSLQEPLVELDLMAYTFSTSIYVAAPRMNFIVYGIKG